MKRASRRKSIKALSVDVLRDFIRACGEDHQEAWQKELTSDHPFWINLLALHLRMVELEHLEGAVGELL